MREFLSSMSVKNNSVGKATHLVKVIYVTAFGQR